MGERTPVARNLVHPITRAGVLAYFSSWPMTDPQAFEFVTLPDVYLSAGLARRCWEEHRHKILALPGFGQKSRSPRAANTLETVDLESHLGVAIGYCSSWLQPAHISRC